VHLVQPGTRGYAALTGSKQDPLVSPVGVAFDDDLRLWVTDSAGKLFAFGADGRLLFVRRTAGGVALARPTGVAYGAAKRLVYVVDTVACAVHAYRADDGTFAFTFGKRGAGAGEFNFPTSIFRTAQGELFVTDSLNFRVAIFDEAGAPRGSFGHHGDGSGDMALPKGLAVDTDGVVYVADALLDNVQLFDRTGGFLVTVGQRGFGDGEFWLPSGVFINGKGELYVCDTYNRRIQVFRITERYDHAS
jgi:sugar lactone lactonase YvrE